MQKIKSMIKKIGAISAGAAMLGATLTGALAADLSGYPAPFVDTSAKKFDYLGVVGADSSAVDNLGLTDITAGLSAVKVPGTGTDGTVSVSGGVSEDLPIGDNIASSNQLDKSLDDSDVGNLLDTTISFQGSDYDVSEHVELGVFGSRNSSLQTGIVGLFPDDDYEDRVVLVSSSDAIKYYYSFDESIQLNKTTSSDPLEIKFLGKTLKITTIDSATKFTANVGAEYYLGIGDSVEVNEKEVKLVDVGSGGNVIVTVDGVQDVVSSDSTKTINGLEIKNDDTFYTDTKAERSAWLVVGSDATESYSDGDAYVGEDEDDPKWVWDTGNLNTIGTTTISNAVTADINASNSGAFIGIESDWNYRDGSDAQALEVGDCIDLPNNYVSICLDSLTIANDNYMDLTFELAESIDLTEARVVGFPSTVDTILVKSSQNDGIKLKDGGGFVQTDNLTKDVSTDEVWIYATNRSTFSVFYKDRDNSNKKAFAGNVSSTGSGLFAELAFDDTKDTNLQLNLSDRGLNSNTPAGANNFSLSIEAIGDSTTDLVAGSDSLRTHWTTAADGMASLGATKSSEEASEVVWTANFPSTTAQNLGTKDENHRTKYGIIVMDPKSSGPSDRVELKIPGDQVQANVVVKGLSATGGSTSASSGSAIATYDMAPSAVLDSEVTTASDHNLILVGGPAVNKLSAQFLGVTYPAYGVASGLQQGEAILSMKENGDKVALIVAGWEGEDTRRAAGVLKNYAAYVAQLKGSEVKVAGTTSSPTVVSSA